MKVGIYPEIMSIRIVVSNNETKQYEMIEYDYELNVSNMVCETNKVINDVINKSNGIIDELRLIIPANYGTADKNYVYENLNKNGVNEVVFINEFYFLLRCIDNRTAYNNIIIFNIKSNNIMAATMERESENIVLSGFFSLKQHSKESNICNSNNMNRFVDRIECVAEQLQNETYMEKLDGIFLYCENDCYLEIARQELESIYDENVECILLDGVNYAFMNILDMDNSNIEVCMNEIGCLVYDRELDHIVNLKIIEKYTQLPCSTTFKFSKAKEDILSAYFYITEGIQKNISDAKMIGMFKLMFDNKTEVYTEITVCVNRNMEINIYTNNSTAEKTVFSKESSVLDVNKIEQESLLYSEGEINYYIEKEFENLIGMDEIKSYLYEFYKLEIYNKKRNRALDIDIENDSGYNFVLYGNPGTGKTTVARIISKMLYKLGIRKSNKIYEVERADLVGAYIGQTEEKTSDIIEKVKAEGATLFIDEAYTLFKDESPNDYGIDAINCILKDMEDNRCQYSVIIAGYKKPMEEMLKKANPGFSSRFNYHIELNDYSEKELILIAQKMANSKNYVIENAALDIIKEKCINEKIDETFSNARFIRTLLNDAIRKMSCRVMKIDKPTKEDYTIIKAEDIDVEYEHQKLSNLLEELDTYIGLESAKKEIKKIINQIRFNKLAKERKIKIDNDFESLHMVFMGNSGTGKTSIARIISKIYGLLGVLKRPDVFIECTRADLIGTYQGSTASKTKEKIKEALGGVLFIDEAYSLCISSNDTYGKEAIDTLVSEMENNRDKLMVIFAGYTQEMENFLEINQGLKSRINNYILFEDYDIDELYDILKVMVKKRGFLLENNLELIIKEELCKKKMDKNFGNARGVRNLVDCYIQRLSERICTMQEINEIENECINTITKQEVIGG